MRTISVLYTGQLAALAGCSEEDVAVDEGAALGRVVEELSGRHGDGFRDLICDGEGKLLGTVLVAFDGRQMQGERDGLSLDGVKEVMLMTPIAGG
ncbi:MAG: MoaD/ThiS family protein [Verrucomicrobiota bacterium]